MAEKKIKVLSIDDEPAVTAMIKDGLQATGKYKVLTAKGGNIGSWLASCKWHKPDLVLLDIKMPGMDGFEVLRKLREDKATALIPVVMLTAFGDPAFRIKAEGLYCNGFLAKPSTLQQIRDKIEEVLRGRGVGG